MAKLIAPFFSRIFPGVPRDHPATGHMVMNYSANFLGLDNAATPIGLKAMERLQTLNPKKDEATDAQIMFLVLNTAGMTLIPVSAGFAILRYRLYEIDLVIRGLNAAMRRDSASGNGMDIEGTNPMRLFAIRDYRRLFSAQIIALFGTGLATVALGLLAYDLAGSNAGAVLGTAVAFYAVGRSEDEARRRGDA